MEYRELGKSGVKVSAITFGAWAIGGWMWGGTDMQSSIEAIHKSIELGVTTIDTAPVYGFGLSEKIVGEAIKGMQRENIQILTKFGLKWEGKDGQFYFKSKDLDGNDIDIYRYSGRQSVIKECEECLMRLGTDYIDLFQIHWADESTPIEETMEALEVLKKQGKIRAGGVCNYTLDQMKIAEKTTKLASNQMPYSMVKRDIEKDLVPFCIENNKGILAYSTLQRGIFAGKIKPDHHFKEGDHRPTTSFYKTENIKRINDVLDKFKPLAQEKNATISQLVIRWTIEQPGITVALVGARNAVQASENAKDDLSFIDMLLKDLHLE